MMMLLLILGATICLILFSIAIAGVMLFIMSSKQGEGVSKAREDWISGVEHND